MKINAKLLLITFSIVCVISIVTAFIYFSLTVNLLEQQQIKGLKTQKTNLSYSLRQIISEMDLNIYETVSEKKDILKLNIDSSAIDFLFTFQSDSDKKFNVFLAKDKYKNITPQSDFNKFKSNNPNILINYYDLGEGGMVYYGKLINTELLKKLTNDDKIGIILLSAKKVIAASNDTNNNANLSYNLKLHLADKNEITKIETSNEDNYFITYEPDNIFFTGNDVKFVIQLQTDEINQITGVMQSTILIIVITGSLLSLIAILLFTYRMRKQIQLMNKVVSKVKSGDFSETVQVITKDEIGTFALTLNAMLKEIHQREDEEKKYTDFLRIINTHTEIDELAEVAIKNISSSLNCNYGLLYLIENKEIKRIFSYGIDAAKIKDASNINYLHKAISGKEIIDVDLAEKAVILNSGLFSVEIKNIIVFPVIFGGKVIAAIEIASSGKIKRIQYLNNILDQLAIGLANAIAYKKLETYVHDLKNLNEEYQKQNEQIRYKNQELIELHTTLQKKAAELETERVKAVELTRLKSEFLASMSHELRTPLNSILGLSELLLQRKTPVKDSQNDLNLILKNGKLLLALISNILEFSKIEAGKTEIKNENVFVYSLLNEIFDLISPLAKQKKLNFTLENNISKEFCFNTDKEKIIQILLNILSNAIKFTESGYIKLTAALNQKNQIQFEIIDTGIGISEEDQKKIFDEFRQLEGGLTRKYGGTGLGLSIAKKYIDLLGGKIAVESEKGVGSIFTITLPVDIENYSEKIKEKLDTPKEKKAVILYSDNQMICDVISEYFKLNDITVKSVDNENKLQESIINDKPIGVIINSVLSGKQTWTVLKEIIKQNKDSDLPIIAALFDAESNLGYALNIYNYLTETEFVNNTSTIIKKIEKHHNIKINKIAFLTDKNESEKIDITDNYDIINIQPAQSMPADIITNQIDLIVLKLALENYQLAPEIIGDIKENKSTRNIPVIALIDEDLNENDGNALNTSLHIVLQNEKHHPLDVLNFIRKRLQISYNPRTLNSLFKEENYIITDEDFTKKKILIVDDDNDTLYTIGEIVKDMGYEVVFARNGLECISQQRKEQPDLILLDIMMPQMDGFETIKRIRKIYDVDKLPVVALTAYVMLENKEIIHKNGFNDLITKPIKRQEIEFKLKKIFSAGIK